MTTRPESNTRLLDQSELRTQQALGPLLLVAAYLAGDWRLVAAQAGILLLTVLRYNAGPYVLLYRAVLRPLRVIEPDVRQDHLEPHRFAGAFGAAVLSVAVYLLAIRGAPAGWVLTWTVAVLGAIASFGWCAGCFMYYVLNRLGLGGFFGRAPVDGSAFPGARPPRRGAGGL
jgi:hypothetical protein